MGVSVFIWVIFPNNSFILHQNSLHTLFQRERYFFTFFLSFVVVVTLKSTGPTVPCKTLILWKPVAPLREGMTFSTKQATRRWNTAGMFLRLCSLPLGALTGHTNVREVQRLAYSFFKGSLK